MLSKITSAIIIFLLIFLVFLNCFHNKKINELNEQRIMNDNQKNQILADNKQLNTEFIADYNDYKQRIKEETERKLNKFLDHKIIKDYDKKILYDPFKAPRERQENDILTNLGVNKFFNISTHGALNDFHVVGTLMLSKKESEIKDIGPFDQKEIENNATYDNNILQLYGREKYPRGRYFEYYTVITSGNQTLKIPLFNKNHQELYDGDKVFIRELNKYYIVSKYPNEEIEYIPT